MKKIIIVLMFFCFLCSCSTSTVQKENNENQIGQMATYESTIPNEASINTMEEQYLDEIFNIVFPTYSSGEKYIEIEDWSIYIKEKHGVDINIEYRGAVGIETVGDSIIYMGYEGHGTGYNITLFEQGLLSLEYLYDLSDYYKKYGWDRYISSNYYDILLQNDEIFAIPVASSGTVVPRYYNKEYIDLLDIEIPSSVNEFYDYINKIKIEKADDENFYPLYCNTFRVIPQLSDVFRAFGVYVNEDKSSLLAFNPNTNSFENEIYSENITTSLEFIRLLQENNLLYIHGNFQTGALEDDEEIYKEPIMNININFASEYNYIYDKFKQNYFLYHSVDQAYDYYEGYFLTGENTEKVMQIRKDIAFYVFPKSIKNIDRTMESFNRIFTDDAYSLDLQYGRENIEYKIDDNRVTLYKPERGNYIKLSPLQYNSDYETDLVKNFRQVIESTPGQIAYEINTFHNLFTFGGSGETRHILNSISESILFLDTISVEEAINIYKTEFKKIGYKNYIDELNDSIGAKTIYNYN